MAPVRGYGRRRRKGMTGKKIVYITPYRNLAVEVMKMYQKNGDKAEISAEEDEGGRTLYIVFVYPR